MDSIKPSEAGVDLMRTVTSELAKTPLKVNKCSTQREETVVGTHRTLTKENLSRLDAISQYEYQPRQQLVF